MTHTRILIVDDEQRTLLFLRESLLVSELDAELVCVSSAEAALDAFRDQSFDLLVTDICLVGMDGVELLNELREFQPNLPAILVSGYDSPTIEKRIRNLSNVRYFCKPFAFEEFTLAVTQALQQTHVDGDQALSSLAQSDASPDQDWQTESIQRRLNHLLQDSGAQSVCLTNAQGHVITQVGDPTTCLDKWVSPPEVGDGLFNFTYHQGRMHDIYLARVTNGVYLVITFDRGRPSKRIGQVLQHTRHTVQELARVLESQPGAATIQEI